MNGMRLRRSERCGEQLAISPDRALTIGLISERRADMPDVMERDMNAANPELPLQLDAIVVGGGLGGLYALHRLRKLGLAARAFEAGSGVGGTWFWNRYPGARCDVESMEYSYAFDDDLQQEWKWPERYGTQPEILRYINHVADRFDLRRDVVFNRRVVSADFDPADCTWTVRTDKGDVVRAPFCIMQQAIYRRHGCRTLP